MRRYLPPLLLILLALAPFAVTGCDLFKKGGDADAGDDGAALAAAPDEAGVAVATDTATPTALPVAPTVAPVRPVVDGGPKADAAVVDAAAPVVADASVTDGGPAPAPTPTLTIPNLFDGGIVFDAGGWKPPWQK